MTSLADIPNITHQQLELLEATGFNSHKSLSAASSATVLAEFAQANEVLSLNFDLPEQAQVEDWILFCKRSLEAAAAAEGVELVSEAVREVGTFRPSQQVSHERPKKRPTSTPELRVDKTRVRTMDTFTREGGNVAPLEAVKPNISKMTLANTNKGVSRHSRRYIRGVLHNQKTKAMIGALAFVTFWVTCWLPLIGFAMFYFDPDQFWWGQYTPAIWLFSAFCYLVFARKTNCPVCRHRQFVPKACVKHKTAHRISGLGLMLPTALHMILFRWARCIFCGTSLRYKE